jgi:hypothetical protein
MRRVHQLRLIGGMVDDDELYEAAAYVKTCGLFAAA